MTKTQLKKWRLNKKLTQGGAAKHWGIPVASWRNWEQGRRKIPAWLVWATTGKK